MKDSFFSKILYHIRIEINKITRVTPEKTVAIIDEIVAGSSPKFTYFLFLIISVVVASVGLINNSAAVIIGAMLISPLMTPIFGVALATVTGRSQLLRTSLFSVFFGVFLAILAAFLIGCLPLIPLAATTEIQGRVSPNLLDLFIAAFAGIAGCIALLDDSVGASLPGVAIATSLAPPLGASGLSLAMAHYADAWGAFLLFFTNFLVISLVSGLLFYFSGFAPRGDRKEQWLKLKKPFWVTVAGIVLVCIPLGKTLYELKQHQSDRKVIKAVFKEKLANTPHTSIVKLNFSNRNDMTSVFAILRAATPISPKLADSIEKELSSKLARETELIIRCNTSVDIVAKDTEGQNVRKLFPDEFIRVYSQTELNRLAIEKVLRESFDLFATDKNYQNDARLYTINDVEVVFSKKLGKLICLAKIDAPRKIFPAEVKLLEEKIKSELKTEDFVLFVSSNINRIITSERETNLPESLIIPLNEVDIEHRAKLELNFLKELRKRNIEPLVMDISKRESSWICVIEVGGDISSRQVREVKAVVAATTKLDFNLYVKPSHDYYVDDTKVHNDDELLELLFKQKSPVFNNLKKDNK
ncbi:MAG: DUF389 domain-containing protein [Lentisphaeraceae bacterium]|nr:DUF389 domain-containing protein [Lentisphaeraceae bacterium]